MADELLHGDVETAEAFDEYLQEQSARIEDIHGSLEAIGQAIAGEEPADLTEHQTAMVQKFKELRKNRKNDVVAIADASALEDFADVTFSLARKAAVAFAKEIPAQFKVTAKGLSHYVDMAQRLRERLTKLRPLLAEREFPCVDVFEYGPYSRFFQVAGKSIGGSSAFQEALSLQNQATRHVLSAASTYGVVVMEKLLKSLQELGSAKPDPEKWVQLRDSIATLWGFVWRDAEIVFESVQTPQVALNEFPERKFTALAALLDNRYLVAHEPKSSGGSDPVKITQAIRHYGASLVFDKRAEKATEHSMDVPNVSELLKMLDTVVVMLGDMRGFADIAKKNNDFARDFAKATDVMSKQLDEASGAESFGFIAEYYKLATAVGTSIQQPYVQMAWMYVRCAMVVTALVELAALPEQGDHVVSNRFFAKQGTEFSNPAMESFRVTQKALQAARRVGKA